MRLRYWTALLVLCAVTGVVTLRGDRQEAEIADAPAVPEATDLAASLSGPDDAAPVPPVPTEVLPEPDTGRTWSRAIGPGESLNVLLAEAGLDAVDRAAVAEAIGSHYDLQRLQPGHRLALELTDDGLPRVAELEVQDGVRVQAIFGNSPSVSVLPPTLDMVRRAGATEIGSSIYAALDSAGIPTRFATDLELVLAGTLDLRSLLAGGERLRLLWREGMLDGRIIGEPIIDFAQLDLGDVRYEILWADDRSRRTRIYRDGVQILGFDQPITGARLSSSFGLRTHPIHGIVRMHSGVDFAAPLGARVRATQAGEIAFMGRRAGYGLMVAINHAGGVQTVYAHLSALNEDRAVGQRVASGDEIGRVGSTGTSTAPHLHYEVLVDGQHVDPLTDHRLSRPEPAQGRPTSGSPIKTARDDLSRLLETTELNLDGNEAQSRG